ncbi:MAG: hypothetical protein ACOH2H_24365 [Cypionkella sp.]
MQKADARKLLDARHTLILAERQKLNDLLSTMTIALRVSEAFRKRPPTETEETVVLALLNTTGLSRACGWKGQIWHAHLGMMCKKREADLWPADHRRHVTRISTAASSPIWTARITASP